MPLRKNGTFKKIASSALATATAALAVPALASAAACPEQPTTKAFSAYGDTADYALAPAGNFENGSTGWTLKNSTVVSGQGTLLGIATNVLSGVLGGKKSLSIGSNFLPGTATVTSPPFCVDSSHPYFRYMLKANGAVNTLTTSIKYTTSNGSIKTTVVPSLSKTTLLPSQWKPSALNPLALNIPLLQNDGQSATVQLVFTSTFSALGAGYQIDNVLIDPYRRG
jgi:hypothetical protein